MEKLDILLFPIHTVGRNLDLAYIVCGKWSWYCRQPGTVCGEWGTRVAAGWLAGGGGGGVHMAMSQFICDRRRRRAGDEE